MNTKEIKTKNNNRALGIFPASLLSGERESKFQPVLFSPAQSQLDHTQSGFLDDSSMHF